MVDLVVEVDEEVAHIMESLVTEMHLLDLVVIEVVLVVLLVVQLETQTTHTLEAAVVVPVVLVVMELCQMHPLRRRVVLVELALLIHHMLLPL
tara:strand:- start:156 stop:434 length:279 start_codon:yes stop_codon:yes gene_type:complete